MKVILLAFLGEWKHDTRVVTGDGSVCGHFVPQFMHDGSLDLRIGWIYLLNTCSDK
jgi:hypothetical protein